jgi:hypothetical protein
MNGTIMETPPTERNRPLLQALERFFADTRHFDTLKNFIEQKGECSLRLLDCLVTNYARDNPDVHYLKVSNIEPTDIFDVYGQYKTQLKSFSKKQFDPFGRIHKSSNAKKYELHNKKTKEKICTTVGQMNFFKWAIQNDILEYARHNTEKIEEYMQKPTSRKRKKDDIGSEDRQTKIRTSSRRVKIHHICRVETFP